MTRTFIAAIAATIALSGAAAAMTADPLLQAQVDNYATGVDVSDLTTAQANGIKSVLSSGDSAAEKRAYVFSIVNG